MDDAGLVRLSRAPSLESTVLATCMRFRGCGWKHADAAIEMIAGSM